MLPARLKTIMVSLLLLGASAGALAFAQRQTESAPPVAPPVQAAPAVPTLKPVTSLLEARIETARKILQQAMDALRLPGELENGALTEIPVWSRHIMDDRLRLASTPAQRLAAIREHRNRMVALDRRMGNLVQAGLGSVVYALKFKYYRLEADQLLTEAGVDPAKEPPVVDLDEHPAQPGPAVPSSTPAVPR
jgi:hypothetical protein